MIYTLTRQDAQGHARCRTGTVLRAPEADIPAERAARLTELGMRWE
ncbi:hypothetical protein ACFXI0_34820 [Kitasatospora indigofera]